MCTLCNTAQELFWVLEHSPVKFRRCLQQCGGSEPLLARALRLHCKQVFELGSFPSVSFQTPFTVQKQLLYVSLDTERCRPVVFSIQVTNPKWDHQQLSLYRGQSLNTAHLRSWCGFPSMAVPFQVLAAQALSMQLEKTKSVKRARRITVGVVLRKENIQWKRKWQLIWKFKLAHFQCKTLPPPDVSTASQSTANNQFQTLLWKITQLFF